MIFHCFSACNLGTSLLHFILFLTLVWLVAVCIYRHSSWETRLVSVLIMYNGRFCPWPYVLLCISILFLKIVCLINFLYDFLVFILNFFYLFFKILKLLMQMCYLLSSARVSLLVYSSWRSQPRCVAYFRTFASLSESLTHFKI